MQINKGTIIIAGITLVIGIALGSIFLGGSSSTLAGHTGEDHLLTQDENGVWTCSMHPQVRQPEAGFCPFCGMDLIPLANEIDSSPRSFKISEEAIALANIQTTMVSSSNVEGQLTLNGKIKIDERNINIQTTHFGGRVEKLYKNFEGDVVRKGEPIAAIYSPELVSAQEELIEAKKLEKSNPVLLQAARKKLEYWKLSEEQINEIESSQTAIRNFDLLADYDGTVTKKMVNNGDHLKQGEGLLEVIDLSNLWAVFEVFERDLSKIKLGQTLSFTTGRNNTYETLVSFIDTKIDQQSRVIEVRGNIQNRSGQLKPDMFIKTVLDIAGSQRLTIPKSAVLWTGKRSVVYVKNQEEESFELREVELGNDNGNAYEITSGLSLADEVVTNGAFTLDAEAQLQGKISMMNTSDSKTTEITPEVQFQEIEVPEVKDYTDSSSPEFKNQLETFLLNYIQLKDLMVLGEGNNIQASGENLIESLSSIDMTLLKGEAHTFWMDLIQPMETSLEKIIGTKDRDEQRLEFINLSKTLIVSIQSFGLNYENPLYVQYCPMANNDQGAPWLSLEEEIINPYFGDMMLNCGFIQTELK